MKGLILAGGKGTRLLPATRVMNKHMVPILNTPMIVYPLETLKHFGIKDIMIVSGGDHIGGIADFLGDGSEFGISLTYRVQKEAGGIAQALALAKDFSNGERIAVILGDNIFDNNFSSEDWTGKNDVCLYIKEVENASRFGVFLQDDSGGGTIVEKPTDVKKGWAVTGLYIYPNEVFDVIPTLKPSKRGELEITDVNNYFLTTKPKDGGTRLCQVIKVNSFWSDAGTPESLKEVTDWAYERRIKN
ncbi:MAG: sugar phosphate nucleotidyltransferase [Bacilli bacterium]|jgi:glucose-1-phosphate thymidylyltransferase